jgi:hypothetical protein
MEVEIIRKSTSIMSSWLHECVVYRTIRNRCQKWYSRHSSGTKLEDKVETLLNYSGNITTRRSSLNYSRSRLNLYNSVSNSQNSKHEILRELKDWWTMSLFAISWNGNQVTKDNSKIINAHLTLNRRQLSCSWKTNIKKRNFHLLLY